MYNYVNRCSLKSSTQFFVTKYLYSLHVHVNVLKNRPAGVKSGWSRHGATAGGKRRAAWLCTCLSTVAHTTVHLALTPHHCSLKTALHLYNKRVSKYPMLITHIFSWQVPLVKLVEPAGQKHKLQPATLFSCMYGVVVSFMLIPEVVKHISQQSMTTDSSLTTDTPQLLTLSFSRWIYSHAQVTWIEYKSVLKE